MAKSPVPVRDVSPSVLSPLPPKSPPQTHQGASKALSSNAPSSLGITGHAARPSQAHKKSNSSNKLQSSGFQENTLLRKQIFMKSRQARNTNLGQGLPIMMAKGRQHVPNSDITDHLSDTVRVRPSSQGTGVPMDDSIPREVVTKLKSSMDSHP